MAGIREHQSGDPQKIFQDWMASLPVAETLQTMSEKSWLDEIPHKTPGDAEKAKKERRWLDENIQPVEDKKERAWLDEIPSKDIGDH